MIQTWQRINIQFRNNTFLHLHVSVVRIRDSFENFRSCGDRGHRAGSATGGVSCEASTATSRSVRLAGSLSQKRQNLRRSKLEEVLELPAFDAIEISHEMLQGAQYGNV